jgi:hypothetical protein
MASESTIDLSPGGDQSAPAPVPTSAITYRGMHQLLADAILQTGGRKLGAGVMSIMADLARVAIRLEMKAISIARQNPKQPFEATFNGVYTTERADLCNAVAAVYGGGISVADARAVLTRIRAEIANK